MDEIASALERYLAGQPGNLVAAWLFGSVARGTAGPDSDVDVAILRTSETPPGLAGLPLRLESDLERLLGCPVQVVDVRIVPVDLVHRVLRDGVLLLETDRAVRVRFEVKARNEYFDLLPILRRYRREAA